jgi:type I restriction-modification system DNA methylase subunit
MISLNEIRARAKAFSLEWKDERDEDAEAKSFWDDFFNVFGVSRRRVASFEYFVNKQDGKQGFVDVLWKGVMLAEHKSLGKDLDKAYTQAKDYFPGLKDAELPRFVVVSDFARIRLYDLEEKTQDEFPLDELHQRVELFGFISGYEVQRYEEEETASIKAAQLMAEFHNEIAKTGYTGHDLEVFLVRILFCLFADDTEIFQKGHFRTYIERRTNEDGSDLGSKLLELFDILNRPEDKRQSTLDEQLAAFPHVNGAVFEERIASISLDKSARDTLLKCCGFNWAAISASIFGSLFQGVMNEEERRQLGAHYTSEINIRKVIEPLFLDELYNEFDASKKSPKKLEEFQAKLASLKFLDPACGCGNFLVTTYRELRTLELQVLKQLRKPKGKNLALFGANELSKIHVNQFYGIEIEEFPALVARTAMYLADHQANLELSKEFGIIFARIPLEEPATIACGNALTLDWSTVVNPVELNYIIGNPPFIGQTYQTEEQKIEVKEVLSAIENTGALDYVSAWYGKSVDFMTLNSRVQTALVSTNSITQGEQVGILWKHLLDRGVKINFAHRTFKWKNEARGNAAVHCVIIGFSLFDKPSKWIYEYLSVASAPVEVEAGNINPYLLDAPDVVVTNRQTPICDVPRMAWGNKPTDGGFFILTPEERAVAIQNEPYVEKYIKRYIGGGDFLNDIERYCLWLVDANPSEVKNSKFLRERVEGVRNFRSASKAKTTRDYADYPTLFRQISQPSSRYLAIPEVSSERRKYIPMAFFEPDVICSNTVQYIADATNYHLGILTSEMHMVWMRAVSGRLKSDYRYSKDIVYNNFPWPADESEISKKIEEAAFEVLEIRSKYPDATLAELYDPNSMPPTLVKAHDDLNKLVDRAYGFDSKRSEPERLTFLFNLYTKNLECQQST